MAALAGKASYGTVSGSVKVNGKTDKLLRYKRVMGFVPQVWPTILCVDSDHGCLVLVFVRWYLEHITQIQLCRHES